MEKLTCQNCGAPLNSDGKCPYCGTIYSINRTYDNSPVMVVQSHAQAQMLGVRVCIPHEERALFRGSEDYLQKRTIAEMRERMADALVNYLRIDVREDPVQRATIFDGTIRVLPPDFMF